jgi:small ligand-binding sensory domain FIST
MTTTATMLWASAASEQKDLEAALRDCAEAVKAQLGGAPADFAAVFVSSSFADRYQEVSGLLAGLLPARLFVGCTAGGVLGSGREIEHRPGLSLVAASLPGVVLKPFALQDEDLPSPDASPRAWENLVGVKAVENPQFLLLADPFSIRADHFVMGLDYAFPKSVKIGGLASGARGPGENALYLNDACHRSGLVGVAFMGNVAVDTIVAQGCKPVGEPMTVTDCRENILLSVDGRPPLRVLQDLMEKLDPRDRELVRHSLFLGLAMDPLKQKHERGDFLVRNIVGADVQKGILAVGALLRKGQTVQFHLRDAETSAEDLKLLLERHAPRKDSTRGALLFSCLGRGQYLYGFPDHDSKLFLGALGDVPLAGFFCNGEIGPVGGTTYLHGYTSCFGLFRPKN